MTYRDPERALIRRAKLAGLARVEVETRREVVIRDVARREAWTPSELAATLAHLHMLCEEIYSPVARCRRCDLPRSSDEHRPDCTWSRQRRGRP